MTKQLRLMDPPGASRRPAPSQPYRRLDDHTREVGLSGIQSARAALAEANRRVAEREAAQLERRENELADRARSSRLAKLTLTSGGAADREQSDAVEPDTGSTDHQSAA